MPDIGISKFLHEGAAADLRAGRDALCDPMLVDRVESVPGELR